MSTPRSSVLPLSSRALVFAAVVLAPLALLPAAGAGQNITLKTVPIPTGEQFLLFPSLRLGMGGVGIAADDPLAAPFTNPARRLARGRGYVYATPTFYGETRQAVGGRSLPISALFAGERLHGGFAVALQQVDAAPRLLFAPDGGGRNLIDNARDNTYLWAALGSRLGERTSVGASVFRAELNGVDGVNLLYARSEAIEQKGELTELRFGFAHDFGEEKRLEGTVTNTRLDMRHDVHYVEWLWNADPPWSEPPTVRRWRELNEDITVTWGTHLRYSQPFDEVARIGWLLAASTKAHPKIPNYNIVNIPRDPGNSTVFNLGVGISSTEGPVTAGLDVVLEPGRSHTWAFADTVIDLPSGAQLQPGDKTVDNQFRFMNLAVALGLERETERFGFQLGLRVRQISYSLDQQNFLAERDRETDESWMEWTPSWSAVWKFGTVDLRYTGRFTAKGFEAPVWFGVGREVLIVGDAAGVDFVVGATEPIVMPEYRVTTHRITLSMPFGRR